MLTLRTVKNLRPYFQEPPLPSKIPAYTADYLAIIAKRRIIAKTILIFYPHCVKSVQIRSFFWSVFSCIQSE